MIANWHCPALCGCVLAIDADWAKSPVNGESYQHPIPGTIKSISIATVCPTHNHFRTEALPADPYFGSPGYLPIPVSPTEAERLYIHLFRFTGQRVGLDTCGCKVYECHDRAGVESVQVRPHPRHMRKCVHHAADDEQHSQAYENRSRKNRVINRLRSQFPAVFVDVENDASLWTFDRVAGTLRVTVPGLSAGNKITAQNWCDTNLGAGKVLIA